MSGGRAEVNILAVSKITLNNVNVYAGIRLVHFHNFGYVSHFRDSDPTNIVTVKKYNVNRN